MEATGTIYHFASLLGQERRWTNAFNHARFRRRHTMMTKINARRRTRLANRSPLPISCRAQITHKRTVMNLRLQGIAVALGELAGTHLERDLAELVMLSLGITFDDLVNA